MSASRTRQLRESMNRPLLFHQTFERNFRYIFHFITLLYSFRFASRALPEGSCLQIVGRNNNAAWKEPRGACVCTKESSVARDTRERRTNPRCQ